MLRVWFMARPFNDRRSIGGFWLRLWPFNGLGFHARLFVRMFLHGRRRRWRRFTGGGHRFRTRRRGGMGRTQAASATATATTPATGRTFPWSGLIQFRLMFIRHV